MNIQVEQYLRCFFLYEYNCFTSCVIKMERARQGENNVWDMMFKVMCRPKSCKKSHMVIANIGGHVVLDTIVPKALFTGLPDRLGPRVRQILALCHMETCLFDGQNRFRTQFDHHHSN